MTETNILTDNFNAIGIPIDMAAAKMPWFAKHEKSKIKIYTYIHV